MLLLLLLFMSGAVVDALPHHTTQHLMKCKINFQSDAIQGQEIARTKKLRKKYQL